MSKPIPCGQMVYYEDVPDAPIGIPPRPPVKGDRIALRDEHSGKPWFWGPYTVLEARERHVGVKTSTGLMILSQGYGTDAGQWVYADEERVTWVPDWHCQLKAVKAKNKALGSPWSPQTMQQLDSGVPNCADCLAWPCLKTDGCPDYEDIAKKGFMWNAKLKRLETFGEAADRTRKVKRGTDNREAA